MADERRIPYLAEQGDPDGTFRAVGPVLLVSPDGKSGMTPEGGFVLLLTNKTGAASVKGSLVSVSTVDDSFSLTPASADTHIGIVYSAGVADTQEAWVVVAGRAEALLEDGQAGVPAHGVYSAGTTSGRVRTNAAAPGSVGTCLETCNSGIDVLCFIFLDNRWGTISGSIGAYRFSISPSEMMTPGTSGKVVANNYAAIEFLQNKTDYAVYSHFWRRNPSFDVLVRVKFILKSSGTGTRVRIGAKVKARATGEDSSTAFDAEQVQAVTVTTTTIGEVFQAQLTFAAALFSNSDAVALYIGRDGNEEIAGGNADDYSKAIQVIAIEVEVP